MSLVPLISDYLYIPVSLAVLGAAISVYTDMRWGLIKNFVTFPLMLIGWSWSLIFGGLQFFLVNVIASCAIGMMARMAGRLGEGDIKLLIGISACLQPLLNALFIAFYFVVLLVSALVVRARIHSFRVKEVMRSLIQELTLELGGMQEAGAAVNGQGVSHPGGPVIFLALVFTLLKWQWVVHWN